MKVGKLQIHSHNHGELPFIPLFTGKNLEKSRWIWMNLWEGEQWISAMNSEFRLKFQRAERPLWLGAHTTHDPSYNQQDDHYSLLLHCCSVDQKGQQKGHRTISAFSSDYVFILAFILIYFNRNTYRTICLRNSPSRGLVWLLTCHSNLLGKRIGWWGSA